MEWQKNKRRIQLISIVLVLLILGNIVFFLSVGRLLDTGSVKEFISNSIYKYTELKIEYKSVETMVFPLPGFSLRGVEIQEDDTTIAGVDRLDLVWNVFALMRGDFELKSIAVGNSKLRILRNKEGEISFLRKIDSDKIEKDTEEFREEQKQNPMKPDEIFELIPLSMEISKLQVDYVDEFLERQDSLHIENMSIDLIPVGRKARVKFLSNLNDSKLSINSTISLEENDWNLSGLRYKAEVEWKDISMARYNDFLAIFPRGQFQDTNLNLHIFTEKKDDSVIFLEVKRLSLEKLRKRNSKNLPDVTLSTKLSINLENSDINIDSLQYIMENRSDVSFHANLKEKELTVNQKQMNVEAKLSAKSFHLASTMELADIFSKIDMKKFPIPASSEKNPPNQKIQSKKISSSAKENESSIVAILDLDLKNLNLKGTKISSVNGRINYINEKIELIGVNVSLYQGNVLSNGKYYLKRKGKNFDLNAKIRNVQMEPLLAGISDNKLLKGALSADISMNTRVGGSDFLPLLDMDGKFTIEKGELLGYANFIKPVAEVGKFINFTSKNEGKSTEFKEIQGAFRIKKQILNLKEFSMDGVGVAAKGSGTYSLKNDKVDMKFTASLAGNAGKAIKIPIIYKGVLGKNVAYLDPVWLASVYAGTLFLAGPAGTLVGGVAGSLASDTVDKTADTVKGGFKSAKNFLFGSKDSTEEEDD
ncbi:MAG: AsmA-like C-terminal domain-containing protein [Leptospira sp.]|nr:AsmA-like C-terminal domain-containing protein [Leptospira sp.]